MQIHVVSSGETLFSIARQYDVPAGILARYNGLAEPYRLAVGRSLLILRPTSLVTVRAGDTLSSLARQNGQSVRSLLRLNPNLTQQTAIYPGQIVVTAIEDAPEHTAAAFGYAYPYVSPSVLAGILPYAGGLAPFTYGFTEDGTLVSLDDTALLAQAAEKCRGAGPIEPIFLHQAMEELDLYGTIDACVCCLDSINYVTSPKKLARAFRRVHTFLMPGGLFLFDINTPQKLRGLDGQMFLDESEDAYCVWRADWSERRRICTYGMDIFRLDPGGLWSRWEEVHEEYAYEPAELEALLRQAGFRQVRQYGELRFRAPREGEQRIFFAARKEF